MTDHLPAFVRTLVPHVVGPLLAYFGFDVRDPATLAIVTALAGYAWYVLVHTVELRWPRFGYLLGVAKTPAYSTEPSPSPDSGEKVGAVVMPDDGGQISLVEVCVLAIAIIAVLWASGAIPR